MNVFYIPSWYPTSANQTNGIFFKEQALALGKQGIRIIISTWENTFYSLSLKRPLELFSQLVLYKNNKCKLNNVGKNVMHVDYPRFEASFITTSIDIDTIVKKHVANYKESIKRFGNIDLIHAQVSYPAGYIAYQLSSFYKKPYVITEHMGPFPFESYKKDKSITGKIKLAMKNAHGLIAVSNALAKDIKTFTGLMPTVIPNMVDTKYFTYKKPVKRKSFVFFTLSHITPEKGIGDLLYAVKKVIIKNPSLAFRIGGSGPFLLKYKELGDKLGIEKNISWLGYLNRLEVKSEMQNCNAYILPSHHESFGLTYLEAMSCGKPVIATRCGGPDDFVTRSTGILIDKNNIYQLADAINDMTCKKFNYKLIRIHAKQYSQNKVAKQIIKKYKSIL